MAKEFMLSAVLEFKDKMTAGIKSAQSGLKSLKSGIESVQTSGMQSQLQKAGASAEGFGKKVDGLKGKLKEVSGDHRVTITAQDNATSAAQRATSAIKSFAASGTKSANLRANDEATPIVSRLRGKLEALTGKAYNVNIRANAKGAEAGMMSKLGSTASGVAGGMLMNTSAQMAGAAGIGYGLYDMVKSAADFEQGMSGVAAISGATGDALQALTDKALEMGQTTKFTATESAQALNYMAMAGWNTDQMMSGLPGVMNLAAASGEDLAQVSDIVTDAMTAFKLPAEESGHFADVLAAAAANANTNVGMMGYTFKYAGSFAGALGYSIEDVALATGAMADSGVKADQAGTSLRALMERMAKPTKESGTAMDILGIKAFDAAGKARPLRDVLDELREKFKGLSGEDQAKFGAMLAGTEGSAGFLGMMNESQEKWDQIKDSIDNASGSAERMAKIRMDNLSGSVTLLGSAWESLSIKIMKGTGTAGGIRSFVDEATKLVTNFTNRVETDGLGFKSIAGTVGEAITDLKNKFIEFDGVGSLLAGGVLAAGLYKVINLAKKAMSAVKGLAGMRKGGAIPGQSGASSVGKMVVNAATVIVNGKSIAGGGVSSGKNSGGVIFGPDGRPIQSGGRTQAPAPQQGRAAVLRANAKALGGAGALAAIFGAMDIYSAKSQNSARLEEAAWGVKQATENIEELTKNGGSQEQWRSALDEYTKANDYRAQVEHDNRMREGDAIGGALGSTVGTVLGGAIGSFAGPAGTMIGMTAGGILGEIAGKRIGSWLSDYNIQNTVTFEKIAQWLNPKEKDPIGFDISGKTVPVDIVGDSIGIKDTTKDASGPFGLQTDLSAIGPHAFDTPRDTSQDFGITEMQNMYTTGMFGGMQEEAQEAASASADAFSEASASISTDFENTGAQATATADNIQMDMLGSAQGSQDAWSTFPSWYDASVAVPTSDAAADCGADVSDSFETSASDTQGAWSGVGGFFSGLFASIKSEAASCAASVAQSMASAAASARAGGHTNIAAGLDWIGNNAAWLGGVSYGGGDGKWTGTTSFVPAFASGGITSFAEGNVAHGLAQVNEHGGELIDLPQGSRIYPAATTERLIERQLDKETPTMPNINITGNSFTVREEADIQKIAYEIARQIMQAEVNFGGAY